MLTMLVNAYSFVLKLGMIRLLLTIWAMATLAYSENENWKPILVPEKKEGLINSGRELEVFEHGIKKAWGYEAPQTDTFIVIHPEKIKKKAPLYVVLHSAGHDVFSAVKCTKQVGNHDIYHSPSNFYALYVDCRANKGDWWWGGMHARDANLKKKNSGIETRPVERRVIDTIEWVIEKYKIDSNRVYLSGNSMGGSGALGIGLRHGNIFAAIKANVPAGIEHADQRMAFSDDAAAKKLNLPDPPITLDYSGQNDGWSFGHDRFVKAMNDRKYPLYFYWGSFGHANNHERILQVNDLINSFDWLSVKKNEAYPVFTNATSNDDLPWPNNLSDKKSGQVNAFFRWKLMSDKKNSFTVSLYLNSADDIKTKFNLPKEATTDVTLRRLQKFEFKEGDFINWNFGESKGKIRIGADQIITAPSLKITTAPQTLSISLAKN
tara:strand:+ start:6690 stop:7994 length:1305 start_codon:yes stop_codon:yes gene_type:complete